MTRTQPAQRVNTMRYKIVMRAHFLLCGCREPRHGMSSKVLADVLQQPLRLRLGHDSADHNDTGVSECLDGSIRDSSCGDVTEFDLRNDLRAVS